LDFFHGGNPVVAVDFLEVSYNLVAYAFGLVFVFSAYCTGGFIDGSGDSFLVEWF
jgi:hypothetical protein